MLFLCYSMTCKWVLGALPGIQHSLTRATRLQFRTPKSVLIKQKMSIKYYHSYLIHLHKSPSILSLSSFCLKSAEHKINQAAILSDLAQNIRSQIPSRRKTLGSSAWTPGRDYPTGHPHILSSFKIAENTTCQAKGRQFTEGKVTQRFFSFDTCTYLAIYP